MGVYSVQDYVIYIAILLGILWALRRYLFTRIALDKELMYVLAPFMLFGILVRVLVDIGVFERSQLWSVTPGVYVITILAVLISLFLGNALSKHIGQPGWKISAGLGILFVSPLFYVLIDNLQNPIRILYPLFMASGILLGVYVVAGFTKFCIFRKPENLAIVFSHLLDGCATFIAYNYYDFSEEHLLPRYLILLAGDNAVVMVPLKLLLILVVVYFIEKWQNEEGDMADTNFYTAAKLLLFILGIGPGIRDMLLPALL